MPRVLSIDQEILVTRSNLEDKNTLMIELKNKVDELALHNEYQLRLKDMNYSEKIKVIWLLKFVHTQTVLARTFHSCNQLQRHIYIASSAKSRSTGDHREIYPRSGAKQEQV